MKDNIDRQVDRTSVPYSFLKKISDYAGEKTGNKLGIEGAEEAYIEIRTFLRKKDQTLTDLEIVKKINNNFETIITFMLSKHSCKRLIRILEEPVEAKR